MKNKIKSITICVDFDGTCVKHEQPATGASIPGAVDTLKRLVEAEHRLVLFTMRSGKELTHAVRWFEDNNIPLYGIQSSPGQQTWTSSPKAYGHRYIDDAATGCPLVHEVGQ